MADTDHVQLTLRVQNAGIARAGFGIAMIASHNATFPERTRSYGSYAEVVDDGFAADSPEALAAAALFGQSPHPTSIVIGRLASVVSQRYEVDTIAVRNSTDYDIEITGDDFDPVTVTYTSDASATDAEINTGIVAALNAVVGRNYLAVLNVTPGNAFTVTAIASGDWFTLKVVDSTALSLTQTHVATGLADELAAIAAADSSWYWLVTLYNSAAYVLAAAAWVEANGKAYIASVAETAGINSAYTAGVSTDTLSELADLGYKRTHYNYHPDPFFGAALTGRLAPLKPGAWTAKFKTLSGIVATPLTSTQRNNLIARRANGYMTEMGRDITFEGTVGAEDYGFLDVVVGLDAFLDDLRKNVFGVQVALDKIAYTDEDIAIVEAAVRASCTRYSSEERPVFRNDPAPTVSFPRVADISPSDRALRVLPDGRVHAELAGAVHRVELDIVITF